MGNRSAPHLTRYLPQVALATLLVAVCPSIVVWAARATGLVHWWGYSLALGIVFSLLTAYAGGAYWKTRAGSEDLLFAEVMLWGWLRRWRVERRLNNAVTLLGLGASPAGAGTHSPERQAQLLSQMASALEARDPYTHGHSRRVARHAAMIARGMGLPRAQVHKIRAAAALHDVGKINTPEAVLQKPGRLTDEEFEVIKRHPVDGAQIVARLGDDELTMIVRHHHERLDGTGYPGRLSGSDIPLGSRIISVADTFDAITSLRPYRPISPHKKALDILAKEAGTQLDPAAVRAFCSGYAGQRPLALWAILTSVPERLVAWAGTELNAIGAASALRVMAAAATSAAVGSAAVISPTLTRSAPVPHPKQVLLAATPARAPQTQLAPRSRPASAGPKLARPSVLGGHRGAPASHPVSRGRARPLRGITPSAAPTRASSAPLPGGASRRSIVTAQAPSAGRTDSGVPTQDPTAAPAAPSARHPTPAHPTGTSGAGPPATPGKTPPSATGPSPPVTGTPVTLPAVTLPSVKVPPVTVGPVRSPPVAIPAVTVPSVSLPVVAPALPPVHLP